MSLSGQLKEVTKKNTNCFTKMWEIFLSGSKEEKSPFYPKHVSPTPLKKKSFFIISAVWLEALRSLIWFLNVLLLSCFKKILLNDKEL